MKTIVHKLKFSLACFGESSLSRLLSHLRFFSQERTKNKINKENQTSKSSKLLRQLKTMANALAVRAGVVGNAKSIAKAFPRLIVGLVIAGQNICVVVGNLPAVLFIQSEKRCASSGSHITVSPVIQLVYKTLIKGSRKESAFHKAFSDMLFDLCHIKNPHNQLVGR